MIDRFLFNTRKLIVEMPASLPIVLCQYVPRRVRHEALGRALPIPRQPSHFRPRNLVEDRINKTLHCHLRSFSKPEVVQTELHHEVTTA